MVSKYRLYKQLEERVKELLITRLTNIKNPQEMAEFLEEFLTPTERVMLAKRFAIALLLEKKWDFRLISKTLKVSTATIISVNYWIKHHVGALKKQVQTVIEEEQKEENRTKLATDILEAFAYRRGANWKANRQIVDDFKRKNRQVI